MWTTEISRKTTATKLQIWNLWLNVAEWNIWDKEVETSDLFGEFKSGTKGILKPAGGPKSVFVITECTYFKSFTARSNLPLCKMDFIHSMIETKDDIVITHKIVMTGFMTFLFSKIIGNKIKATLPFALDNLIEISERHND